MIIVDLQQILLSNMFMAPKGGFDESTLRHMALNSIRSYRKKHKDQYGELVIACDSKHYWRKDVFPYYKANRKKSRDESPLDWAMIFESLHKIRDELKETFSYRVIDVNGAEADDVIATLVFNFGDNFGDRILILSSDKDFVQLHTYPGVDQFAPAQKKWVRHPNPSEYLKEHILVGDTGDGVPNVLSPDDVLVAGSRQATMSAKRKEALLRGEYSDMPLSVETVKRNIARNNLLINMNEIPKELQDRILASYEEQANKSHKDLWSYFIKHKLKNLTESMDDF